MNKMRELLEAAGVSFFLSDGGTYLEALWKDAPGGEMLFTSHNPPDMTPRGYFEVAQNTPEYTAFDLPIDGEPLPLDRVPFGFVERVASEVMNILRDFLGEAGC